MSLSIFAAAAQAPQKTALVVSGEEHSFAEMAARVRCVLPSLRRLTADAERAALVGETDLATLTVLYALIEIGQPVLLLHPRSSPRERERLLAASAPVVLLDPESLADGDPSVDVGRGAPEEIDDERCLAVVPTSGSGGRPKGVVLARRAFVAAARASAENLGWEDGDRWLLTLSVAHVGGLSILTRCLLARRTVVVHRGERFDAAEVAQVLESERVTLLSLVPTTLKRLVDLGPPPEQLRAVLVGGAAASPSLLTVAADRGWPVLATYGLTEACSQVATQPYGTVQRGEMGCGPPLPGTEVRIRDGKIEVRGPQLATGYLPAADDPFTADGWLTTGDLGRLDSEGRLHVLGRRDEVITSGGENVHAAEVEQVLEEHPGITEACVFGVADVEWGEAVAAVVVTAGPLEDGDVEHHLRARLAGHKIPWRIAELPEFPRLPSGKLDRRRTRTLAASRLRVFERQERQGRR